MTTRRDENHEIVSGFATKSIVAVTLAVEWTPDSDIVKFRVPAACTYKVNNSALSGSLAAGAEVVILDGFKYTFDTSMNLELM